MIGHLGSDVGLIPSNLPLPLVATRQLAKKAKGGKDKKKGGKGAASAAADEDLDDSKPKVDVEALKEGMRNPADYLQKEYASMQIGRATPQLLDHLTVDLGGNGGQVPLPSIAKVLAQGPHTLTVSCFEAIHVNPTVAAVERDSAMGLHAEMTGKMIKVSVPRPTQDSRAALAKHAKVLAEAAKTAVRSMRQKAMKDAKGERSKDEVKRSEKLVEEATKAAIDRIDAMAKAKEKDVLTV